MQRKTEIYIWTWVAHHRLQYGPNWHYVSHKYITR